jgi:RING-variant domain/FHA domain
MLSNQFRPSSVTNLNLSMSVLDYSQQPSKLSFYAKDGGTGAAEVSRNNLKLNQTSTDSLLIQREKHVCRICLCEEEPDNSLIWPCKCSGSMGAIHISCLREWLNGKRVVYEGNRVTSYFWKALECELCKEPFENKLRSSLYSIMQFERPEKDYMILESIKSAPAKVVHVFDLKYDYFAVGRSIETDMKIADISVSRTHSFFKIGNGKICVEDNGSKFGTLVKI